MESEFLSEFGWREALIAIVVLLTAYIVHVYWRMRRLKAQADSSSRAPSAFAASAALAAYSAEQTGKAPAAAAAPADDAAAPAFAFPWEAPAANGGEGPPPWQELSIEVEQLRREVGGLRAEVLMLREALQQRSEAVEAPPPEPVAPPRPPLDEVIAPQYSEALQLAQRRVAPADISQQCGITRAEAELVAALARNRDN